MDYLASKGYAAESVSTGGENGEITMVGSLFCARILAGGGVADEHIGRARDLARQGGPGVGS